MLSTSVHHFPGLKITTLSPFLASLSAIPSTLFFLRIAVTPDCYLLCTRTGQIQQEKHEGQVAACMQKIHRHRR